MANMWENNGNSDQLFILFGSKITADGDCSHEIKRLASQKENYDKPRHILKSEDGHKGPSSQSYGFSSSHVWIWQLDHKEGWTLKNWYFQTVVLEKTLKSPLDSKEIKPSFLKEINPEYSLERLMLKLKLQYFGHMMWRTDLFGKDPDAGKDWRWEEKGTTDGWIASLTRWTWVWLSSRSLWWTGRPGVLQSMESQRVGHDSDWTELNWDSQHKHFITGGTQV